MTSSARPAGSSTPGVMSAMIGAWRALNFGSAAIIWCKISPLAENRRRDNLADVGNRAVLPLGGGRALGVAAEAFLRLERAFGRDRKKRHAAEKEPVGVARAALRAARAVRGLLPRLAPESGRPRAGGAGARAGAAAEVAQAPEGEGEHGADKEWGGKRLR